MIMEMRLRKREPATNGAGSDDPSSKLSLLSMNGAHENKGVSGRRFVVTATLVLSAILIVTFAVGSQNMVVDEPGLPSEGRTSPPIARSAEVFRGSTLSQISDGMDVAENVCIRPKKNKVVEVLSYTEDGEDLKSTVLDFFDKKWGQNQLLYAAQTKGNLLDQWQKDTEAAETYVSEDTLMIYSMSNPGHCLQDAIFSLQLDRYQRRQHNGITQSSTANLSTFYPNLFYIPVHGSRIQKKPERKDWCLDMLNYSGLADARQATVAEQHVFYNKKNSNKTVCFRRLLLPRIGVSRFPFENNDTETIDALHNHKQQKVFILRSLDRPPFTDSYPKEALNDLRRQALNGLGLTSEPWQNTELYEKNSRDLRIFVYDRQNAPRRRWTNSLEVIHRLQVDYHANITRVDPALWETMTLREQASLLNSFPRILIPHGGHEGGLIFCRPNASVIELECMDKGTASLLQENGRDTIASDSVPSNQLAFYGPPNFYTTYTRRIDIDHFVIGEVEGCGGKGQDKHYARELVINSTRLVEFVADKWRLTPRENDARAS